MTVTPVSQIVQVHSINGYTDKLYGISLSTFKVKIASEEEFSVSKNNLLLHAPSFVLRVLRVIKQSKKSATVEVCINTNDCNAYIPDSFLQGVEWSLRSINTINNKICYEEKTR